MHTGAAPLSSLRQRQLMLLVGFLVESLCTDGPLSNPICQVPSALQLPLLPLPEGDMHVYRRRGNSSGSISGDAAGGARANDIVLLTRAYYRSELDYKVYLVRSLCTFWPTMPRGALVLVLDQGSPQDEELGPRLAAEWPFPRVVYAQNPERSLLDAQIGPLFADTFVESGGGTPDFIGLIDTDTLFVSSVTRSSLFDESSGKPFVLAQVGNPPGKGFWDAVPGCTSAILGRKAFLRGMSYFPVLIKTEHFASFREHVSRQHPGRAFVDVIRETSKSVATGCLGAFDLLVNYIYFFHRDEYHFRIQRRAGPNDPATPDARFAASRSIISRKEGEAALTRNATLPLPRIALNAGWQQHLGHHRSSNSPDAPYNVSLGSVEGYVDQPIYRLLLEHGWCLSGGAALNPAQCEKWSLLRKQKELVTHGGAKVAFTEWAQWTFEGSGWLWDKRHEAESKKHFEMKWASLCSSSSRAEEAASAIPAEKWAEAANGMGLSVPSWCGSPNAGGASVAQPVKKAD